jgi:hypothetical protein
MRGVFRFENQFLVIMLILLGAPNKIFRILQIRFSFAKTFLASHFTKGYLRVKFLGISCKAFVKIIEARYSTKFLSYRRPKTLILARHGGGADDF